jgi:hypothetical protein
VAHFFDKFHRGYFTALYLELYVYHRRRDIPEQIRYSKRKQILIFFNSLGPEEQKILTTMLTGIEAVRIEGTLGVLNSTSRTTFGNILNFFSETKTT